MTERSVCHLNIIGFKAAGAVVRGGVLAAMRLDGGRRLMPGGYCAFAKMGKPLI